MENRKRREEGRGREIARIGGRRGETKKISV
jgi:hypothetical protein